MSKFNVEFSLLLALLLLLTFSCKAEVSSPITNLDEKQVEIKTQEDFDSFLSSKKVNGIITSPITLTKEKIINSAKTIDLNGNTITFKKESNSSNISNSFIVNSMFTILDSKGNGKITSNIPLFLINQKLKIQGGSFDSSDNTSSLIVLNQTGELEVINGSFSSSEALIEDKDGILKLYGGLFSGLIKTAKEESEYILGTKNENNTSLLIIPNGDTSWFDNSKDSFSISTSSQLIGLSLLVNQGNNFSGKTITLSSDINMQNNIWTPIGSGTVNEHSNSFSGTFDGNNHIISNLTSENSPLVYGTLNDNDEIYFGLFGTLNNATIKNLTLENINFIFSDSEEGYSSASYTLTSLSILAGFSEGSLNISGINIFSSNISGSSNSSALVGILSSESSNVNINNVEISSTISSQNSSSGLFSLVNGGNIEINDVSINGEISTSSESGLSAGFISTISDASLIISNSVNFSNVSTNGLYSSGFIALINDGSKTIYISDSTNKGNISGNIASGFVALDEGDNRTETYNALINSSTITGENVSGIIYSSSGSTTLSNISVLGVLNGEKSTSGIIGTYKSKNDVTLIDISSSFTSSSTNVVEFFNLSEIANSEGITLINSNQMTSFNPISGFNSSMSLSLINVNLKKLIVNAPSSSIVTLTLSGDNQIDTLIADTLLTGFTLELSGELDNNVINNLFATPNSLTKIKYSKDEITVNSPGFGAVDTSSST